MLEKGLAERVETEQLRQVRITLSGRAAGQKVQCIEVNVVGLAAIPLPRLPLSNIFLLFERLLAQGLPNSEDLMSNAQPQSPQDTMLRT